MFGHSHCNANNSEVDVNNGQNKTILKIHPHPGKPPLQTKDGKMAWFFWPSWIQGGGGWEGGRERVDICFSISFCLRLLLHFATSPLASGFLIKPDIRTFKMQK